MNEKTEKIHDEFELTLYQAISMLNGQNELLEEELDNIKFDFLFSKSLPILREQRKISTKIKHLFILLKLHQQTKYQFPLELQDRMENNVR